MNKRGRLVTRKFGYYHYTWLDTRKVNIDKNKVPTLIPTDVCATTSKFWNSSANCTREHSFDQKVKLEVEAVCLAGPK